MNSLAAEWSSVVFGEMGMHGMSSQALEWSGAVLGLLGALLLATHSSLSRFGWVAFLGANLTMIGFALSIDANGLLVQQLGFTATSLLGLHRCGLLRWSTAPAAGRAAPATTGQAAPE